MHGFEVHSNESACRKRSVLGWNKSNMDSLDESLKYVAVNTTHTETNEFYVIMFVSEVYILQDNTTIDVQIINVGELVVKAQYICSMQVNTN